MAMANMANMAKDAVSFLDALPSHPKPEIEESLCGYAWRIAVLNGFGSLQRFTQFCAAPASMHSLSKMKWRWYWPPDAQAFEALTHLTPAELDDLTLLPLVRKFRPADDAGLIPSPRDLVGLVRLHPRVCPLCLSEQPWLRRLWSFASVVACVQHGVLLADGCSHCGQELAITPRAQGYLTCAGCGQSWADMRSDAADEELRMAQESHQAELQYLLRADIDILDSTTAAAAGTTEPSLVARSGAPAETSRLHQLAAKFGQLQHGTGLAVLAFARAQGLRVGPIYHILRGDQMPVGHYLTYLAALGYSWAEFAALPMPTVSRKLLESAQDPHAHLRRCPTEGCPNAAGAPSLGVQLRHDWPERQVAGFLCRACGRSFMRHYDGTLHYRDRGTVKRLVRAKPADHLVTAQEMGLQGMKDGEVDKHFGWECGTAKAIWVKLGILAQVRSAQAQRRHHEREVALRARAAELVQQFEQDEELLTMRMIVHRLGRSEPCLRQHTPLHAELRDAIDAHNARVQQRRLERQRVQFEQALTTAQTCDSVPTLVELAKTIGCPVDELAREFPDLFRGYKDLRAARRKEARAALIDVRVRQINEAALRLFQAGARLSKESILREAHLHKGLIRIPLLDQTLCQWTSGLFSPGTCDMWLRDRSVDLTWPGP